MIYLRKNTRLRLVRGLTVFMAFVMVITSLAIYFEWRLRSVVIVFAKSAVESAVIDCANRASLRVLENTDLTYDELAVISRNDQGLATTVEINGIAANRLKSEMSDEMAKRMAEVTTVEFSVPFSAAFGIYFAEIRRPVINYKVQATTTVQTNIESVFSTAGINQVLHQINLKVTLKSDLAINGAKTSQITVTEFLITQTVIVGAVPEAFTSVGHATDEVMEDIFDFGAQAN